MTPKVDHRLHVYSKSGSGSLEWMLPPFTSQGDTPVLGYVVLVDVAYEVISPREYVKASGMPIITDDGVEFPGEKKISPEKRGWLRVKGAVEEHKILTRLEPDAPYVVAVVNPDTPNAMPLDKLREELQSGEEVKLIPCNTEDRGDVKHVLLELMAILGPSPDVECATKLIQSL